jgi:hypothetical protein
LWIQEKWGAQRIRFVIQNTTPSLTSNSSGNYRCWEIQFIIVECCFGPAEVFICRSAYRATIFMKFDQRCEKLIMCPAEKSDIAFHRYDNYILPTVREGCEIFWTKIPLSHTKKWSRFTLS